LITAGQLQKKDNQQFLPVAFVVTVLSAKAANMAGKYWLGRVPVTCDVCSKSIETKFFDARVGGSWGNVCESCFEEYDGQLGLGQGQRYELDGDGHWPKTGG
jgi:hypothetical protein